MEEVGSKKMEKNKYYQTFTKKPKRAHCKAKAFLELKKKKKTFYTDKDILY